MPAQGPRSNREGKRWGRPARSVFGSWLPLLIGCIVAVAVFYAIVFAIGRCSVLRSGGHTSKLLGAVGDKSYPGQRQKEHQASQDEPIVEAEGGIASGCTDVRLLL